MRGRGPGEQLPASGAGSVSPEVPLRTPVRQWTPAQVLRPRHLRETRMLLLALARPGPSRSGRLGSEHLFLCLSSPSQIFKIKLKKPKSFPAASALWLPHNHPRCPHPRGGSSLPIPGSNPRHLNGPGAHPQSRGASDPRVSKVPGRTVSSRRSEPSARHHGSLGSRPRGLQAVALPLTLSNKLRTKPLGGRPLPGPPAHGQDGAARLEANCTLAAPPPSPQGAHPPPDQARAAATAGPQ